jgi:hypothetical protein
MSYLWVTSTWNICRFVDRENELREPKPATPQPPQRTPMDPWAKSRASQQWAGPKVTKSSGSDGLWGQWQAYPCSEGGFIYLLDMQMVFFGLEIPGNRIIKSCIAILYLLMSWMLLIRQQKIARQYTQGFGLTGVFSFYLCCFTHLSPMHLWSKVRRSA